MSENTLQKPEIIKAINAFSQNNFKEAESICLEVLSREDDSDANIDFSSDEISSDEDDEANNSQPLTEEQAKKNAAIRKLQESLDSVQEDIGDGLYLQIMNLMKDNYIVT